MAMSINEIAKQYATFIEMQLKQFENFLHPSSTEDEELVRRASFAVRNKAVIMDRFIPFSETLYATVQDVRAAEVRLDFNNQTIQCSCRQNEYCRHKLAVILSLYQYLNSVQEWAASWRAQKNVQLTTLANTRSPESWLLMVDEVMTHLLKDNQKVEGYFIPSLMENARSKIQRHLPFEREWQPLFKLFIELAMVNKLWKHLVQTNSTLKSDYFEFYISKTFERLTDLTQELNQKSRLFATDPFYDELQHQARILVFQEKGLLTYRLNMYLQFWNSIFNDKRRASDELIKIKQLDKNNTDLNKLLLPAIPYIILKNNTALDELLPFIRTEDVQQVLAIAQFALNQGEKLAATKFLKAALPLLQRFIHETLSPSYRQMFTRYVDELYSQISLDEHEYIMLYTSFGKYGIRPFADYLLLAQRYDEWVSLHLLYPSSLSHLEAVGLKEIIAHCPAIALPLYHQYAMEEVRQKSRMNYKQAVRIWKAMKTVAKKAGKITYFKNYMETIQQNYKRLRALQEEIDKSNLLA